MPVVLRVRGYRFFFSREGNEPAHIHVDQADRYAKLWLNPISVARTRGFKSRELSEIIPIVHTYRDFLEEKWDEHKSAQG